MLPKRIRKLIADWRAERRRKRELYNQLDALTDYGLLDRILGTEPRQPLTFVGKVLRYRNTPKAAKVQ